MADKTTTYAAKPLQSDEAYKAGKYAFSIGNRIVMVPANMLTDRQIDAHARAIAPDTRHNGSVPIDLTAAFVKQNKLGKPDTPATRAKAAKTARTAKKAKTAKK